MNWNEGIREVSDVKIQGKGKVKGYALPTPSADEVEDEGEGE